MVQKDQNRNEWKMPLELFGSFVRETTIVDSSREDQEKRRIKNVIYLRS